MSVFVRLSSEAITRDDAAMDCCGPLSLCGDGHSCHPLFTLHLSQEVSYRSVCYDQYNKNIEQGEPVCDDVSVCVVVAGGRVFSS